MRKHKVMGSLAALALSVGGALVALAPAATPAWAAGCTITSQGLYPNSSSLNYNVTASSYCSSGYKFRAVQRYVNNQGSILTVNGAWKTVGTSTATRPASTLFNSGTYEIG